MYSTDLAVTLRSHCCLTWLHSALFVFHRLCSVIIAHPSSPQLNSLFLFITQTRLSLSTFIIGHSRYILLYFCSLFSFFSHFFAYKLDSVLLVPSKDLALILNSHYCTSRLNSPPFMHSTDLTLTGNGHYCAFKLHSALFMHSTDLAVTLISH